MSTSSCTIALWICLVWSIANWRSFVDAGTRKLSAGGKAPSYAGYAAICVVGKDENRYVREWVEYHKCLGISKIYLYDHGSKTPMSPVIADHIAAGFVSYRFFTGHHQRFSRNARPTDFSMFSRTAQGYAYTDCVKRNRRRHQFLGFIDLDEYLVFMDANITTVEQLLKPYEQYAGLAVHWVLAGPNNHTTRPVGSTLSSYTTCMGRNASDHRQFKTFANTAGQPRMSNPHRPHLRKPEALRYPHLVDELFSKIKPGSRNKPTHARAAVYHFVTRSRQDFDAKLRRGGGAGVKRKRDYFEYAEQKCTRRCTEPIELQRRLCPAIGQHAVAAEAVEAGAGGSTNR